MRCITVLLTAITLLIPSAGWCWGDEGHEIVALIAVHYLSPGVRARVAALLAGDSSGLTATTGIADEATWADRFRDSDREVTQMRYQHTRQWHYIDIEIDHPDVHAACFDHAPMKPRSPASAGPAEDCILNKIEQFRDELASSETSVAEQRLALQFLLHLVGDLHQPLHAADNHDQGANLVPVRSRKSAAHNLHQYWDSGSVEGMGRHANVVAGSLIAAISPRRYRVLSAGTPLDWTRQTFDIARRYAYAKLPRVQASSDPDASTLNRGRVAVTLLDDRYEAGAEKIAALQLERAGVRLARLLNTVMR